MKHAAWVVERQQMKKLFILFFMAVFQQEKM
jgi:hypothetical protein